MASRAERWIAALTAAVCAITSAVSLGMSYGMISLPAGEDFLLPAGQGLREVFLGASWYIPVFYLLLTAALIRNDRGKRLAALLYASIVPFLTAVLMVHIISPAYECYVSRAVTDLLGVQPSAFIVGFILLLQLLLMLLTIKSGRKAELTAKMSFPAETREQSSGMDQASEETASGKYDGSLRFPFVPEPQELTSFTKKYAAVYVPFDQKGETEPSIHHEEPQDLSTQEEQPAAAEEDDEKTAEKPSAGLEEEKDASPSGFVDHSRQEDERKESQADLTKDDERSFVIQREDVDLKNTVTPTLPPEDPQFQNIVEKNRNPEKQDQDEIDKDWTRRGEKEKPRSSTKPKESRGLSSYAPPSEQLLSTYPDVTEEDDAYTQAAASALMKTFEEFGIEAQLTGIQKGPVVTMFEILPAPGVRVSSITNLSDNIALQLAASRVRIVAPIPGKQAVGIEVPNRKRTIVSFKEMLSALDEHSRAKIPMVLGKDIMGELKVVDLVRTPHLLIAGATGSGKSVCVNSLICSILYRRSPRDVRLMLIDPKIVELKLYNDIPHLLTPVITESKKTLKALQYCIYEMERRYSLLDSLGVRDVSSYNAKIKEKNLTAEHLPYIVVILDEFADLMNTIGKELENYLARLAAMARAVGIHLVLATQRPSTNVITGLIKANIPSRIAFMVVSNTDSRIIIDMPGAEKLLGRGDMLFLSSWEAYPTRIQGAFLSEEEVERIAEDVKAKGEPDYLDESYFLDDEEDAEFEGYDSEGSENDPLMSQALRIIQERSVASASMLQRRLKIGYNRAARMIETMEEMGVVGPAQGSKPREVLKYQEWGDG